MSSLPVPDSPRIRTPQSWGATFSTRFVSSCITVECPMILLSAAVMVFADISFLGLELDVRCLLP